MHEAATALIRVHKANTQKQKLRTKTSKISMSQRDNRKSCHSDQYLADPETDSPTDISVSAFHGSLERGTGFRLRVK
jgi:hypothetical protein